MPWAFINLWGGAKGCCWCPLLPQPVVAMFFHVPLDVSWGVPALFTMCREGSTLGVYILGVM